MDRPLYFFGIVLLTACSAQNASVSTKMPENVNMEIQQKNARQLVIKAKLQYTGAVGYGNIYSCAVIETLKGNTTADTLNLVVMDTLFENFITGMKGNTCLIRFEEAEKHVPYHLMPLTGFVDEQMTSWKVVSMDGL